MTTPAGIKKLLERKWERKEAKLNDIVAIDKEIEETQERIKKLIEKQRTAFESLLVEGFSTTELAGIGITRRRRIYNANNQKSGPATTKSPENPGQTEDSATYNEGANNHHHDEGS